MMNAMGAVAPRFNEYHARVMYSDSRRFGMKKSMMLLTVAAGVFVLLTGFHGGCGSDTPEARVKQVNRMVTAHVDDLLDDIEANDAQRKRIHAIKDDLLKEAMPLYEDHRAAKAELRAEWMKDAVDPEHVHAIIDGRVDAFRTLLHKVADGAIELHAILTPKQRAEITKRWKN
jgi:hypothetical protein